MSKWILVAGAIIIIVLLNFYIWPTKNTSKQITNFDECAAAGNPIMESYPPRCTTNGQTFTQDIGNELEYSDVIQVTNPRPNQTITSPLLISGQARGTWYFEASFPVELQDANGITIGTGPATAQGDWMTEGFVPFTAGLTFTTPSTSTGNLIIKNANASGLPENEKVLLVPIKFQ